MKTALTIVLLVPFLSFSQVSKKDKKSIDEYAASICSCINTLMDSLHPKTAEVILLIAEKGEEEAMIDVEAMMRKMSEEEILEFLTTFETMQSDAFEQNVQNCDTSGDLNGDLEDEINDESSAVFSYLMEVLSREDSCEVMKVLYEIGSAADE